MKHKNRSTMAGLSAGLLIHDHLTWQRLGFLCLSTILLALLGIWTVSHALLLPSTQSLKLLAQMGGQPGQPLAQVRHVAAWGSWTYALEEHDLTILDTTYPGSPQIRGRLHLPEGAEALAVRGHHVYVAHSHDTQLTLLTIDVSDPDHPAITKQVTWETHRSYNKITSLMALSDRVYLLTPYHFYALDPNGQESPVRLTQVGAEWLSIQDLGGKRLAYLGASDYGYNTQYHYVHRILDITQEDHVQEIGQFQTKRGGQLVVVGTTAYLASGEVLDITDFTHPRSIGFFENRDASRLAWMSGFLATNTGELVDVTQPHEMFPIIAYTRESIRAVEVAWGNTYLLMVTKAGALRVYGYYPSHFTTFHQEAEQGSITPPMTIIEDATACRGQAVKAPQDWADGSVAFQVNLPVQGQYFLWARAKGSDWTHNSFRVQIDDQPPFQFEIRPPDGAWHWQQVYDEATAPRPLSLTAGPHTIRFLDREALSALDTIHLTNHPSLLPSNMAPCVEPPQLTPTPTFSPTPFPPTPTPTPTPLPTPQPFGLLPAGHFGGHPLGDITQTAVLDGPRLFAAQDDRITVVAIADPYQFHILSRSAPLPGPIQSMALHQGYLYVQANGLSILDARATHLLPVTRIPDVPGHIIIRGNRLYLVTDQAWIIYDISQPDHPQRLGQVDLFTPYEVVDFQDNLAFVARWSRLFIYDLTQPSTPQLLSILPIDIGAGTVRFQDILISQDTLYLLYTIYSSYPAPCPEWRVRIIDIHDPTAPTPRGHTGVGVCNAGLSVENMVLWEHTLYISNSFSDDDYYDIYYIDPIDVSDPDHPHRQTSHYIPANLHLLDASASILLGIFTEPHDVQLLQRESMTLLPLDPVTQSYQGRRFGYGIGGHLEHIYLWGGDFIHDIDNHDPAHPHNTAQYKKFYDTYQVTFDGPRAYMSAHIPMNGEYLICAYDFSHPVPGDLCQYSFPHYGSGARSQFLAYSGPYVFQLEWDFSSRDPQYTQIFDATHLDDIQAITVTTRIPLDAQVMDCCGSDPWVIWAMPPTEQDPPRLEITHLRQPEQTFIRLDLDIEPLRLRYVAPLLYILTPTDLRVLDFSDLQHLHELGRYPLDPTLGEPHTFRILGTLAYVGIGNHLLVIDFHDPTQPRLQALANAPKQVLDLYIREDPLTRSRLISLAADETGMINLYEIHQQTYMPIFLKP